MHWLILALRCLATLAAGVFVYGVWTNRVGFVWGGWMGAFLPAEGLGILAYGTYSGVLWWLRSSPYLINMLFGAILITVYCWIGVYHGWLEKDLWPQMRRTYVDDGIFAVLILVGSLLTGRIARKR